MFAALFLSLGQLSDRRILLILGKSVGVTLLLFAVLGGSSWWLLQQSLGGMIADEGVSGLAALVLVLIGGWLLWRVLALAVLQFYADDVVIATERRFYPMAAASAHLLGWRAELGNGVKGAGRALAFNLLALPVALALLFTGLGPAAVFWLVNAVLLGRELTDMVWQRHRAGPDDPLPLSALERLMLGGLVAALLTVPLANLLAPVMGAAMATHLVHRKRVSPHAA